MVKTRRKRTKKAESEHKSGVDHYGVPINRGCLVATATRRCDANVILVTDVRGIALMGIRVFLSSGDDWKPELGTKEFDSAACPDCVVICHDVREYIDELNEIDSPGIDEPSAALGKYVQKSAAEIDGEGDAVTIETLRRAVAESLHLSHRLESSIGILQDDMPHVGQTDFYCERASRRSVLNTRDLAEMLNEIVRTEAFAIQNGGNPERELQPHTVHLAAPPKPGEAEQIARILRDTEKLRDEVSKLRGEDYHRRHLLTGLDDAIDAGREYFADRAMLAAKTR